MPKYTKTMEVEVEFYYVVDPPDPTVGINEHTFHIYTESIEGVPCDLPSKLDDKLCEAVEEEIRDEWMNGEG